MKAFTSYLTESTRRYEFRIRLACEMSSSITSKIKQVLEAYKLDSISTPKRLPIHESPMFPNMGPVEVNIIDISLCYPTTVPQLRTLIAESGCVEPNCIVITPLHSPFEATIDGLEQSNLQAPGESVLMTPEMKTEKADTLVGQGRIDSLIKELADMRKYEYPDAAGGKTTAGKTLNQSPTGNTSPLGSKQNKIPSQARLASGK